MFQGAETGLLLPLLQTVRVRLYRPREAVALAGSRRAALYLVLSGRLCAFDLTADGRRLVLEHIEPGGVDGFLAVAGLKGHFTEAMVASEVAVIDRSLLERIIEVQPRVAVNLLWAMSRRLQRREEQVEDLIRRHPSQRLAGQLLALADDDGQRSSGVSLVRRLSHETLAEMLGLRRETVTQHLGRLRAAGAVEVEGDSFKLRPELLTAIRDGSRTLLAGQASSDDQ